MLMLVIIVSWVCGALGQLRTRFLWFSRGGRIPSLFIPWSSTAEANSKMQILKCHCSSNGVAHEVSKLRQRVLSVGELADGILACVLDALANDCKNTANEDEPCIENETKQNLIFYIY